MEIRTFSKNESNHENETLTYDDVYELFNVIVTVIGITICLYVFLGLCISCFLKSEKPQKKRIYKPSKAYFANTTHKNVEDNFYLSEVSPSSSDALPELSNLSLNKKQTSFKTRPEDKTKLWVSLPLQKFIRKCSRTESPTTVLLSLKFAPANEEQNKNRGKLHISIKDVVSLPSKDYPRYTEAYLVVRIVQYDRGIKGRSETVIYEKQTKNFRNTRDINIDEHFVVDTKKDWKNWSLIVTAYDQDIYTKPAELASTTLLLSQKYKELLSNGHGIELHSILNKIPKNNGILLVGLSYLPTSQRLSVNISRIANLPESKDRPKMYAQLFLLTGVTGRSLKRKKLLFFPPDNDPYALDATLSFDITPCLLETVTLLIILYNQNINVNSNDDKKNSTHVVNDIEKENSKGNKYNNNDYCYGSVAIGNMVSNPKGKKHWKMMMVAPRRVVTVWHSLK